MIEGMSKVTLSYDTIETNDLKSARFSQEGADESTRTRSLPEGFEGGGKVGIPHPSAEPLNKVKMDTLSITTLKGEVKTVTGEHAEKDASALERAGFFVVRRMKQK